VSKGERGAFNLRRSCRIAAVIREQEKRRRAKKRSGEIEQKGPPLL